jgi:hypothetical protein
MDASASQETAKGPRPQTLDPTQIAHCPRLCPLDFSIALGWLLADVPLQSLREEGN